MSPLLIDNNDEEIVIEKDRRQSILDKLEEKLQKAKAKKSIVLTEEEKWKHFEETGTLEDWQGKIVNISGEKPNLDATPINNEFGFTHTVDIENWRKFNGKKLIFKNCPNLRKINAECLGLTGLEIKKCPKLEKLRINNNNLTELDLLNLKNLTFLDVNYNQLESIDLKGCKNLEQLYCTNNELQELELKYCKKIKFLHCSYNYGIRELELKHLKKLVILHCEGCRLIYLDCENLKRLTGLYCFDNGDYVENEENDEFEEVPGISVLKLDGCVSLKTLDAAENSIEGLILLNLSKLEEATLKDNKIATLFVKNCSNLKLLDISLQGDSIWDNKKNQSIATSLIQTSLYIDNISNLEEFLYTEGSDFFLIQDSPKKVSKLTEEDFSHLKIFECSTGITSNFDRRLDERRQLQETEQREQEMKQTDSESGLTYYTPTQEQIEESGGRLDLSWRGLTGNVRVADQADLETLNLGHNKISIVIIRNCPKLTKVILSHNGSSLTKVIIWKRIYW